MKVQSNNEKPRLNPHPLPSLHIKARRAVQMLPKLKSINLNLNSGASAFFSATLKFTSTSSDYFLITFKQTTEVFNFCAKTSNGYNFFKTLNGYNFLSKPIKLFLNKKLKNLVVLWFKVIKWLSSHCEISDDVPADVEHQLINFFLVTIISKRQQVDQSRNFLCVIWRSIRLNFVNIETRSSA